MIVIEYRLVNAGSSTLDPTNSQAQAEEWLHYARVVFPWALLEARVVESQASPWYRLRQ